MQSKFNKLTDIEALTQAIMIVVDNESRDGYFIKKAVKELGYENVKVLVSSREAIDLVLSGVGDILFLDLNNKTMNGLEAVNIIKSNPDTSSLPIILVSHNAEPTTILDARKAGVDGFVIKPITARSILSHIQDAAKSRAQALISHRKESEKAIKERQSDLANEYAAIKQLYNEEIRRLTFETASFPWYDVNYTELGKMLTHIGEGSKAVMYFRFAMHLSTNASEPYERLSDYHASMGDYDKAVHYLKGGLSVKFHLSVLTRLGELQLKKGDVNDAIVTFNKVIGFIENDPKETASKKNDLSKGLNERGKAFREKSAQDNNAHLLQRAADDFKRSSEFNPNFLAAHYNLMVTYKAVGDTKSAMEVFDRIKTMEPSDFEDWLHLAEAYHHEGNASKTAFALERAMKLELNDLPKRKRVCELFMEYGLLDKAEALLKQTQQAITDDIDFYNKLGIIYRRRGKAALAVEQYTKALELVPNDAVVCFNLGRALHDAGNMKKAAAMFQRSLELDPDLVEAREFLGRGA